MTRTSLQTFNCSLARTADIIGDKWTLLILRDAFFGATSYSHFQKSTGIARNILANRLDKLIQYEIFEKIQTRPGVERYHYQLTERGQELMPMLVSIMQWGDKWVFGEGAEPITLTDKESGLPIQSMQLKSNDNRILTAQDIRPTPGPAADEKIVIATNNYKRNE